MDVSSNDCLSSLNTRNRLLNWLTDADRALLKPHLRRVDLRLRQPLQSANRQITTAYFLETGMASVVAVLGSERFTTEVGLIGNEGMTGSGATFGASQSPFDIFIQSAGSAQAISIADLRRATKESATLASAVSLFCYLFLVQCSATAVANAHGTIEERLARWILMAHDRIETNELVLTHEFLSLMLGVRRAGVTVGLRQLEAKGLIKTSRGTVCVHDRPELERYADDFYGVPEREFARVFK